MLTSNPDIICPDQLPREYASKCSEPAEITICAWCSGEIYDGGEYYVIAGDNICESCIDDCKQYA